MKFVTKLVLGLFVGILIGGIVGFFGAILNISPSLTAGVIGPVTAAIVSVVLLNS